VTPRRVLAVLLLLVLVSAAFAAGTKYRVERSRCTGCGDCMRICPVDAVEIVDGKSVIDQEACISCGLCQGVCTHDAIR